MDELASYFSVGLAIPELASYFSRPPPPPPPNLQPGCSSRKIFWKNGLQDLKGNRRAKRAEEIPEGIFRVFTVEILKNRRAKRADNF